MIRINIEPACFEYDIQSLIMAFFPGEETIINGHGKSGGEEQFCFHVQFADNAVVMEIAGGGKVILKGRENVDFSDRKETKNRLKRLQYSLLSSYTGKKLPWGTLTGIRPVRIPLSYIEAGHTTDEAKKYMKDTYLVSDKKIDLSIDIAEHELDILKSIDYKKGYSVYIGIPFCPTTCLYCSFTSYPISVYAGKTDAYIEALIKEIEYTGRVYAHKSVNTVYIGGGTPTTLNVEQLDKLLAKIEEIFDLSSCLEFTVEAGRPDSITEEKLKIIKRHKVTRISINPQTMNQKTLDLIGRKHTTDQVRETYALARKCGFDNINMDFIVGLPGECYDDIKYSMEEVIKLSPDSLTIHSMAIKRAARINMFKEDYSDLEIQNSESIMDMTRRFASEMDMSPYYLYRQKNMAGNMENVGYAVNGKEGSYNILIMEQKQTIMALGAGSVTKFVFPDGYEVKRVGNLKNVDLYIERIDEMIAQKQELIDANPTLK